MTEKIILPSRRNPLRGDIAALVWTLTRFGSRSAVAECMGVSPAMVSRYISGHRVPEREKLRRLAYAFKLDPDRASDALDRLTSAVT